MMRFAPFLFLLLWSSGFTALKVGLADAEPFTFLALRYLCATLGDECFHTRDEVIQTSGRAEAGLKLLCERREWRHPNIANDELPSATSFFTASSEP